jgi:hypothetical protein
MVLAESYVTTVQEQDHAVQKPMAEILTSVAVLVALHSGHAIVIAHAQHKHTWLFLQDYFPVMGLW